MENVAISTFTRVSKPYREEPACKAGVSKDTQVVLLPTCALNSADLG